MHPFVNVRALGHAYFTAFQIFAGLRLYTLSTSVESTEVRGGVLPVLVRVRLSRVPSEPQAISPLLNSIQASSSTSTHFNRRYA